MQYHISHLTTYTYDCPVALAIHTIRLRPRCDITQTLHSFALTIAPTPTQLVENIDLDGNASLQAYFSDEPTSHLTIETTSNIETYRVNPFNFMLEPWATHLPIDYPVSLLDRLQPYLTGQFSRLTGSTDPVATQLAQEVWLQTAGNTVSFLTELNQRIHRECNYQLRQTGQPHPAGITWTMRSGSCRDYAMLMIETCRAVGLAARFVSGYQEGDLEKEERDLHAWAEVYLPGAGWRGYDPTHGLAVADTHIALVASPTHQSSAPIEGKLQQSQVPSKMDFKIKISKL